ncbi:MAG TPA: MiaB/RimO family radical SAM methylthiotransferase [Terriglobales bacterium]|nr:MiaB/RimO family radical SAM methylthiotransferase [Terriglobales bacterium]
MSSFYVENFGCRATQADGAAIEQQFRQQGLDRAEAPTGADFVVLNTCAVTAAAEQDARAAVRRIRRQNPDCKIVMTGCYAQRAPAEVAALAGVSHVIGNSHKHTLAQIALRETAETNISQNREFIPVSDLEQPGASRRGSVDIFVSDIFAHTELLAAPVFDSSNERTRPNLKIQDGCNNRCSFCIIPSLRGRSRSLPVEDVLREVNQLVEAGYREVVLSGINLGRWGRDLKYQTWVPHFSRSLREVGNFRSQQPKFEHVIRTILTHTSVEKLRISSVEPMDWTDSLIQLVAESPRIAKHSHVPMQSGSDAVLRRMHRKYRPWHYREKIERIRAAMPDAAIGADVMVGFPGETDAEFEETRHMIEDLPFTYLHVFTFSARPGTPAATMPNQIPVHIARERNRVLRELAAEKKLEFMRSFIGRELQAITLNVASEDERGLWTEALTDNYLKMRIRGTLEANQWLAAHVVDVENGELSGLLRSKAEQGFESELELPPVQPRSGGRMQPGA